MYTWAVYRNNAPAGTGDGWPFSEWGVIETA